MAFLQGELQLPMYYEVWLAVVNTFPQQLPFPQQYQGGDREAPTTVGPISFIFIQFSEKFLPNKKLMPPFVSWRPLPRPRYSGSITAFLITILLKSLIWFHCVTKLNLADWSCCGHCTSHRSKRSPFTNANLAPCHLKTNKQYIWTLSSYNNLHIAWSPTNNKDIL